MHRREGRVASNAKLTIRVRTNRSGSAVSFSSTGRVPGLDTAGYQRQIDGLSTQPTENVAAFWLSSLGQVVTSLTENPEIP